MNFHPLFVSLPVTVATSFAFSLPMGTPPNLLVYSKGYFSQMEMVCKRCTDSYMYIR